MDFFKNFFKPNDETHSGPYLSEDNQDDLHPRGPRIDIFSDPTRMHQYFEHQINEMLKSFHDGFSTIFPVPPDFQPTDDSEQQSGSLRDHFLRDGYQKYSHNGALKADEDLDEKVKNGNLDSLLEEKRPDLQPYKERTGNFFSSQSQSFISTTHPNGTIQTESTKRDNEGNEETTVCHKLGNKEYCVIRRKNKYGKEEISEKFINISDEEKNDFSEAYKNPSPHNNSPKFPFNFFT